MTGRSSAGITCLSRYGLTIELPAISGQRRISPREPMRVCGRLGRCVAAEGWAASVVVDVSAAADGGQPGYQEAVRCAHEFLLLAKSVSGQRP